MNMHRLGCLAFALLFGLFVVFGFKTGTVPGLGGPVGVSFDRDEQPKRFWLLMTINAMMAAVAAIAAAGLIA